MPNIKILIGEDDVFTAEHLSDILQTIGQYDIEMAHNKEAIIAKISTFLPDIAFLDIRMKNKYDGIEIGEYILKKYNFPVIYITAHADNAMMKKALKTKPGGYLLKPFQSVEVNAALHIALKSREAFIIVKSGHKNIKLLCREIIFVKSDNMYVQIVTLNNTYRLRTSLSDLYEKLGCEKLIRIHQSYIVNVSYVKEFNAQKVKINNTIIPISRKYKDAIDKLRLF